MANRGSFQWSSDRSLFSSMDNVTKQARMYLSRTTQFHGLRAEAYAKSHAPWTDRTGNARSGLATYAAVDQAASLHFEIIVYGQVNYEFWLDTKNPDSEGVGRYAIIVPTIREESPAYFESARHLMGVLFGGESI